MKKTSKDKLRILFGDIIKGFSITKYLDSFVYLKHLNVLDNIEIEHKKELYLAQAISKGLPTVEEKEDFLFKEGLWKKSKDEEINKIKNLIRGLKNSKSKAFRQNDIDFFKKEIDREQLSLNRILMEKNDLIGYTAEDYANKKTNEYFIFTSLYKNGNIIERLFSEKDYEDLTQEELSALTDIYNAKINDFSSLYLKKVALSSYYLNIFNICNENISNLYGKPIVGLTYYQVEIYNYARYFKHELSESKHKPPIESYEDPDLLIEWLESAKNAEEILSKSANKNKKNQDFVASSLVGASKGDIEKITKNENAISLQDVAKKHGGTLSMDDFIKLHKV